VGSFVKPGLKMDCSVECCEDVVRVELLLDRLPTVEVRSWDCLLAIGTGGGIFFWREGVSEWFDDPLARVSRGGGSSRVLSWESTCVDGERMGGSGSGLFTFRSEPVRVRDAGEGVGSVALKSSKETTCGVRDVTGLPCRCRGGGGFFFSFSGFFTSSRGPTLSSSDAAISSDVCGDSSCGSWTGSKMDCRDIDEVSVLLLLSNWEGLIGFRTVTGVGAGAGAGARAGTGAVCEVWPELDGLWIPVMSNLLKLSTSRFGFAVPGDDLSAVGRSDQQSC
jgi:hypothetical protein